MIALWLLTGVLAAQGGVEPPEPPEPTPAAASGGWQKKRRYDPLDPRSVRADIEGPAPRKRETPIPVAEKTEIAPDQPLTLAAEIAAWEAQLNEARQVRHQVMRSQLARAHLAFDDMTRQLAELDDEQALVLLIH